MQVTITGGTGLIGRRLTELLLADGHTVHLVSRSPKTGVDSRAALFMWDTEKAGPPIECLEGSDAVVHLAGESLAQRWTSESKRRMHDSRVKGTAQLLEAIGKLSTPPQVLVSASAIGYYGSRGDEVLTETSAPGEGFLPDLCKDWEEAADAASSMGIRVVKIRTGLVLANGGTLARMLPPFQFGVGGKLGNGRQWMSWIHIDDEVGMIRHAMENLSVSGAWNGTAPNPVRNEEFTRTLARVLRRPAFFTVPERAMRIMFGEMAELLFVSQRILPKAAEDAGFRFAFPDLGPALKSLLS